MEIAGAVLWTFSGVLCLVYAECMDKPFLRYALVGGAALCWVAGALCVIL